MTSRPIARRSLLALLGAAVLAPQPASAYVDTVNGVEVIVNGLDPKPRSRDAGALPAPKHESASAQQAHVGGGTPVAVAPAYDPIAARAIVYAEKFIGVPYVWGGTSPSGFDCSGFVQFVFNAVGVPIPRTADVQFAWGRPVAGFPIRATSSSFRPTRRGRPTSASISGAAGS